MPTIDITDNTDIILSAECDAAEATLNRYLASALHFKAPPALTPLSSLLVKDQRERDFPITLSATGEGEFALDKTTVDIQTGGAASIGLLKDEDAADFYSKLNLSADPASSGLLSFGVTGALTAADTATPGDFTFGITKGSSFTLTSYRAAAANDQLLDALKTTIEALTVPRDIADLESIPPGAICSLEAKVRSNFRPASPATF